MVTSHKLGSRFYVFGHNWNLGWRPQQARGYHYSISNVDRKQK